MFPVKNIQKGDLFDVIDNGYIRLIDWMGSDETIIAAARQSTDGAFRGWGGAPCPACKAAGALDNVDDGFRSFQHKQSRALCKPCKGTGKTIGDEKLLRDLFTGRNYQTPPHTSPFEMGEILIEVQAPLAVFREWHRHRTWGYNEFSARYAELPDLFYVPSIERLKESRQSAISKQGTGGQPFTDIEAENRQNEIKLAYELARRTYKELLVMGVAREVARLVIPVGQISRMYGKTDLLNMLKFLRLRLHESAQWEIRQYAIVLGRIVKELYPRTYALFEESLNYDRQMAANAVRRS